MSADQVQEHRQPLAVRLWIYQRERFPLFAHGLLIAAMSLSALGVSTLLSGRSDWPSPAAVATAFVTLLLVFLQLRVADEFKDYAEDFRYRPYRAVPRGLVSLNELAGIGAIGAVVQLALALWLEPRLAWLLLIVWAYYFLMSAEFFAKTWLKVRPVIYLWTHMPIIPLILLYATACDWLVQGGRLPLAGLVGFLLVGFWNGVAFEIGRKIRAPDNEEEGVETYSALWGRGPATMAWGAALVLAATAAVVVAAHIDFVIPVIACAAALLIAAAAVVRRFLKAPTMGGGKLIESLSAVWSLALFLVLGVLPLAFRT